MTTLKILRNNLNNFSIVDFQIGIIFRFICYQQPNQILLNNKQWGFSEDAVWILATGMFYRFTMAYCLMSIYEELKKAQDVTVWSIMVKSLKLCDWNEIAQVRLFLLTGEAGIVNALGSPKDQYLTCYTRYTDTESCHLQ